MRLYISGPMTGIREFNYPAFMEAERQLSKVGYEGILNPARINETHNKEGIERNWTWYMRHALIMVCEADGIALLEGWENSRGAKIEVEVATALTLPVFPLEDWMENAV